MATTRLLRTSRPLHLPSTSSSLTTGVRYQSKAILNADNIASGSGKSEMKPPVPLKASLTASDHLVTSKPKVRPRMSDPVTPLISVASVAHIFLMTIIKQRPRNLHPQLLVERAMMDCRFFTLFGVIGSLLGSVFCFLEGCFLVMESYLQYFKMLSQRSGQGHVVQLVIEAIDMFLVAIAMLIFGVGLYVMFVRKRPHDIFYTKSLPRWIVMQSIAEAKSKIGHAVMMILQVGLLDKFKDIPLQTGFDLACFAAAVLTSSVSIFLLSRQQPQKGN